MERDIAVEFSKCIFGTLSTTSRVPSGSLFERRQIAP